jgi:predicted transcriptional regulator
MQRINRRQLKADMILRGLSLRDVSKISKVPYSTCSQILNGHWVHPEYLRRIQKAISSAPVLQEA